MYANYGLIRLGVISTQRTDWLSAPWYCVQYFVHLTIKLAKLRTVISTS